VETINYSGGKTAYFSYDKAGRLVEMNDWTGRTSFTLDLLGRITAVNDQNNRTTTYEYDAVGNQTEITYPDSTSVLYEYDGLNRIKSVTDEYGTTAYTFDSVGRVQTMTHPNGVNEIYEYDKAGQLIKTTANNPAMEDAEKRTVENTYVYDAAGNVLEAKEPGFETMVSVDAASVTNNSLNQMTAKTIKNLYGIVTEEITYSYDRRGNLVSETSIEPSAIIIPETGGEPGSGTGAEPGTGGELGAGTEPETPAKVKTFEYDSTNKMVKGVNAEGEVSEYTYNGLGILVSHSESKITGTTETGSGEIETTTETIKTDFVVDYTSAVQNNLMAFGSDGINYSYTYGNSLSKISAKVTNNLSGGITEKLYIQSDRLGSGRQATDAAGVVQAYTVLDEWGKPLEKVKAQLGGVEIDVISNYTNHDFDEVLQIYYAKARFYDPNTQRFLAVDIIKGNVMEPESLNPYLYVLNNPLLYFDLDGWEKVKVNGEVQDWFTFEKNGNKYVGIQNIMSAYGLNPKVIGNTGGINITANGSRTSVRNTIEEWNFNISLNASGLNASAVFYGVGVTGKEKFNLGGHMSGLMIDYDYFKRLMCINGINGSVEFGPVRRAKINELIKDYGLNRNQINALHKLNEYYLSEADAKKIIDSNNINLLPFLGFGSFPDYDELSSDQRSAYNDLIYTLKPETLWPIGGDSWINWKNYPLYNDTQSPHTGNDIAAPSGTDIYSAYYGVANVRTQTDRDGKITGGGNYVVVSSTINGNEVDISYMHMLNWAIQDGATVEPGSLIGYVGSTGNSTGPHLHFQIGFGNSVEDPFNYLPQEPIK
jgi:RHS repeat-associated protein